MCWSLNIKEEPHILFYHKDDLEEKIHPQRYEHSFPTTQTTKSHKPHIATRFCFLSYYQTLEGELEETDSMNEDIPYSH